MLPAALARPSAGIARVVGVALVSLAGGGCSQILGVDGYAVGGGGGAGGYLSATYSKFVYSRSTCRDCMDKKCPTQAETCAGDPSCAELVGCIAQCTDPKCVEDCNNSSDSSDQFLSPATGEVLRCQVKSCDDVCGVTTKKENRVCGIGGLGKDCAECCCDETYACDSDATCQRAWHCKNSCAMKYKHMSEVPDDDECFVDCLGPDADAGASWKPKLTSVLDCTEKACTSACPGPWGMNKDDWSCLGGREKWPLGAPQNDHATIYFWVSDFTGGTGLPAGTTVTECSPTVTPCQKVVSASPDPAGYEVFSVGAGPINPYFSVTTPGDTYPPAIVMQEPPFAHTGGNGLGLATRALFTGFANGATPPITVDPSLGTIAFRVGSCSGGSQLDKPIRVKLVKPGDSTQVLGTSGSSQVSVPDESASFGAIFNVPPPQATIEYSLEDGTPVGTRHVFVQPGFVTVVSLSPTP